MENLRLLVLFDLMIDTNRVCVNLLSLLHVWALELLSPDLLFMAAPLMFLDEELVDDTQGWNHLMAFKLHLWPKKIADKLCFAHVKHSLDLQVPAMFNSFPSLACSCLLIFSPIWLLISILDQQLFFGVKFRLLSILLVLLCLPQNDLTLSLWLLFVVQICRKPEVSNIIIAIFDIQTSHTDGKIQGRLQKQYLWSIEVCFTCFSLK